MTTATEAKRTPGPWRVIKRSEAWMNKGEHRCYIYAGHPHDPGFISSQAIADMHHYAGPISEADAEYIVRACNAHDELVAALRKSLDDREVLTVALVAFVTAAEGGATTFFHSKGGCLDVAYKALRNVGKASGMKLGDFDTEFVTGARAALARATGE